MLIKEVFKDIYSFSVILPNSPLRAINAYVIKTPNKAVLFDTGYNDLESKKALIAGLEALDLKITDIDLYLTHLHSDHVGLAPLFYEAGCRIFTGAIDGQHMNNMANGKYWELIDHFRFLYDLEQDLSLEDNPGFKYRMQTEINYTILNIGEIIEIGDYHFEVMDVKGHTPGHIAFYDKHHKIMLSGDTVLDPITPNITYWGEDFPNSLGQYFETLSTLYNLDINYLFATHRNIITNHKKRISELFQHHEERLQEILDVMQPEKEYTIKELSGLISWKIKTNNWNEFPRPQKWFAAGETMAHMEYLLHNGYVSQRQENNILKFTKTKHQLEFNDPLKLSSSSKIL